MLERVVMSNLTITRFTAAALVLGSLALASPRDAGAAEALHAPPQNWSWQGIFGTFDRHQLQRGFQVYREVCSACHALNYLYYRNLIDIGYSEAQVKAIAAEALVTDGPNDSGEMFERAALPSDLFARPFPNDKAAASVNNGAVPKDLSMLIKARHAGDDYVLALMTGYREAPPAPEQDPCAHKVEEEMPDGTKKVTLEGTHLEDGQYYNPYFPGCVISMAPPLTEGQVTYADGTPGSVEQMSRDVVAFMTWASEPTMEARKKLGIRVLLFLIVLTGLFYAVKRKVWADVH